MKISIIIPVYNEQDTVLEVLRRVQALDLDKEIILVDNKSTDGTREILQGLEQTDRLRVILNERNLGKGGSVRKGIAAARGEWVIVQDGDLEYDPSDILRLLAKAESEGYVAVFGSRILGREKVEGGPLVYSFGRRFVNWWFRALYGQPLSDVSTCYKLVRRERLQELNLVCSGFDLDFEIPAKLVRTGVRIAEEPISYSPRTSQRGKKLTVWDGVWAVWAMLRFRFARASRPPEEA